ncbi:MAG: tRNA (N(6)-L-threonylcarbamoyladenosine(37)-C(2))-methylthiotransferase MtaB [Actinobacteria bacterium]|nr:tRNA (N(6)-L-threonylcarbamoyladenosine(37)-C(2))-methylthiotransferase MtaB [Actinomycetota bacterium]
MKVCAFYTLGCKVNQYETEKIIKSFEQNDFKIVDFSEEADVYVINTCTVTTLSDRKSRQIIRRAIKQNPQAAVIVTGCYAEISPEEISLIDGVDLIVGNKDKDFIIEKVSEFLGLGDEIASPSARNDKEEKACSDGLRAFSGENKVKKAQRYHTRALIKIQDGCDQFCAFCKVPYVRNVLASRSIPKVLNEAELLASEGVKEIVLTGIHLGKYGIDLTDNTNLVSLLTSLIEIKGIERIRLSSIEAKEISDELISLISSSGRICRHLHIPLQSGSNEILKMMGRNYTKEEYLSIMRKIKNSISDFAITTDIIVGFPSEKKEHFEETLTIAEEAAFSKIHVFKFSPRKGTPAAGFSDQVGSKIKNERSERLLSLGERLRFEFINQFLGKELDILVEKRLDRSLFTGLSDNYIRVVFEGAGKLEGDIVKVKPLETRNNLLYGELVIEDG